MPIKRNENILPLSRDHHFGLLFCWKIREGLKKNVESERISGYVNWFWETNLHKHFEEEENILFNKLQDEKCEKALQQHKEIERQINNITKNKKADPGAYAALADLIDEHIRFEERELFPFLEKTLPPKILSEIGSQLNTLHTDNGEEIYPNEFWIKKQQL